MFALSVIQFKVQVYPNPSSDFLNINIFGEGELELRITDLLGRMTIQQTISSFNQIDVSSWTQGIHLIEILHLDSRQRAYVKFVKSD